MNSRRLAQAMVLGVFVFTGVYGCARSTKVEATTTTLGEELQDLDDAHTKGLLTEEEYAKKRKEIMKRR